MFLRLLAARALALAGKPIGHGYASHDVNSDTVVLPTDQLYARQSVEFSMASAIAVIAERLGRAGNPLRRGKTAADQWRYVAAGQAIADSVLLTCRRRKPGSGGQWRYVAVLIRTQWGSGALATTEESDRLTLTI